MLMNFSLQATTNTVWIFLLWSQITLMGFLFLITSACLGYVSWFLLQWFLLFLCVYNAENFLTFLILIPQTNTWNQQNSYGFFSNLVIIRNVKPLGLSAFMRFLLCIQVLSWLVRILLIDEAWQYNLLIPKVAIAAITLYAIVFIDDAFSRFILLTWIHLPRDGFILHTDYFYFSTR